MTTNQEKFEQAGLSFRLPVLADHTMSGTFGECLRMGYYAHGLGLIPQETRMALHWGKTFHAVTETWQTTSNPDAVANVIRENIEVDTGDRYGRNQSRMVEAFVEWVKYNRENPIEVLRTEQPTAIKCLSGENCPYNPNSEHGCNLEYGGRLDRIVRWNNLVGPLDIKTTIYDESDPTITYKPSHQMEGYLWIVAHLIGRHPWGVIVERVVCNKSKLFVRRFPVPYAADLIREWAENERRRLVKLRKMAEEFPFEEIEWEQNHGRCSKPYMCEFRQLCLAPRDMDFRLRLMRDNYLVRRWDFTNPDSRDVPVEE